MTTSVSLLEWLMDLFRDENAREAFKADPESYAAQHGFQHVSAADMRDALCLAADDDDRVPSPRHHDHDDDDDDNSDDDNGHHGGTHYLKHYVNNYTTIEKHETNIDNSVHQDIDTGGGDFSQVIDNDPVVASGDGAVAAGGDITDSTLTTGSGNVVGDNNQAVTGDDNSAAFGSGDANGTDIGYGRFGDGAALSVGANADGYSTDNDTSTYARNSGDGSTTVNAAGEHGYADGYTDQHAEDNSSRSDFEDHSSSDSHDTSGSHNDANFEDSHNYEAHG